MCIRDRADTTNVVVKIKKDGVATATTVDINEDKTAAVTAKLLRGRRNKRELAAEDDDMNNNEVGAAAAAIVPPKRLKVEVEHAPTAIPAGNLTSGEPGSVNHKWTTSYPKRWQNPLPLADLSEPSHPFHEVWQKWNPSHKPAVKDNVDADDDEYDEPTDQEDGKDVAVQMDMID